jgi:hypothetical protein
LSPVPVPGGAFFGPPFPPTPFPQGFGFPPGVHASPQGPGASKGPGFPPCAFRHASRLLPSFQPCFPGTGGQEPGLHALLPGCQGQAFRGPGFRSAFMLSGARASSILSGGHAFGRFSEGHTSPGLPGIRASLNFFFFAASAPSVFASQPPGFQEARGQTSPRLPGSMLSGDRRPGTRGPGFPP